MKKNTEAALVYMVKNRIKREGKVMRDPMEVKGSTGEEVGKREGGEQRHSKLPQDDRGGDYGKILLRSVYDGNLPGKVYFEVSEALMDWNK